MKTLCVVLALTALGAVTAQAGWEPILGLGVEIEKPRANPAIWAGIVASIDGEEIGSLSTDTPVSVVGLRDPRIAYSIRVGTENLRNVDWVKMGINGQWGACKKQADSYEANIPSIAFRKGPNLVRVRVHGKFKIERFNLLIWRPSIGHHDEFEGQFTMYMTEATPRTDPVAFLASRGWIPMVDDAPPTETTAQPVPLMEYGPAYTPPAPADSASVETEAGAGATAVTPVSPVRFYWAGEEITGGRLKIRAGAEELTLRITCPAGPTSIKLDRPGKKVWEDEIVVDPPLILRIGPVPAGESRLTIGTSAGTFELSIQGGDG